MNLTLNLVDVRQKPEARQMLFERRGRGTVPVLGIPTENGEKLMPESDDIIRFLREQAA